MAKRRAEDTLLHDSPFKRCYRSLYNVDMRLQSKLPTGGVSLGAPSLMASLDSRCRKRPHFFEDLDRDEDREGGGVHEKTTRCDARKHAANVLTVQTSGSFEERRSFGTFTNHKKRHRANRACPSAAAPKASGRSEADTNIEDCTYNSFQYWRVPLPEVDLSLLEDAHDPPQAKDRDSSSEAMET